MTQHAWERDVVETLPQSSHDRTSLDPTFQGVVRGATGGPKSLAGTPLLKIDRGLYILAEDIGGASAIRAASPMPAVTRPRRIGAQPLTEDEVKQGVKEFLETAGFHVSVSWGRERGVDIEAVSSAEVLLLEAKGSAQNPPQQVNYFLGSLHLPPLVWERLNFTILFVSKTPRGIYTVERISKYS
jgi:hypothetical protein